MQQIRFRICIGYVILALTLVLAACSGTDDPDLELTRIALSVEQTVFADKVATSNAPTLTPNPAIFTKEPIATPTEEPTSTPIEISATKPPQDNESNVPSFEDWLPSAKILLYEDMAGYPPFGRWILSALTNLNLDPYDTGDGIGNFREALVSDRDWDLVIYASENRNNEVGTLFGRAIDAFDIGSSLIIEHWDLDDRLNDSSSLTLLMRHCGLELQSDWFDEPDEYQLLFAHNTGNDVHNNPNKSIRLTDLNSDMWHGDLGDLMKVVEFGSGEILFGARSSYPDSHGTVASCFDNRVIIQTHSTHQYEVSRILPLWENYIMNSLLARYNYIQSK